MVFLVVTAVKISLKFYKTEENMELFQMLIITIKEKNAPTTLG
jgi:hypothetical protein